MVADEGKVYDSDRVMFLRVSHAAPASDTTRPEAMSPARVAYGPVDETDGAAG